MDAVDVIRRLHHHRAWVSQNLLSTAATLSDEQLRQAFAIGQGSIWKSLLHLYAAEYVWLAALRGDDHAVAPGDVPGVIPGNQQGSDRFQDLDELRQKWAELEQSWTDYLTALSPESLDQWVYKVSSTGDAGTRFRARRSDVLMHVSTHAHYTAAQVVNMFRQAGVEKLPPVMLMALARKEDAQTLSKGP